MKKTIKVIAISMLVILMMLNFTITSHAAVSLPEGTASYDSIEFATYLLDNGLIKKDVISPLGLLDIYLEYDVVKSEEGTALLSRLLSSFAEQDITNSKIVKCSWAANGDNKIMAKDAQMALVYAWALESAETQYTSSMKQDIASKLGISASDVKISKTITIPQKMLEYYAEFYGDESLKTKKVFGSSNTVTIDESTTNNSAVIAALEGEIASIDGMEDEMERTWACAIVFESTAVATTKTQKITYKFELGKDAEWYWYPVKVEDLTPADGEFKTELDYIAVSEGKEVEGKVENGTFLPPYFDNEDKDAHKDADAIAIITSKTEEEIVATNGVALTDKNTKDNPNSEGWYYPDVEDKTVIAKVYPFDKYDNTTDNGAVKETVKLTGKDGGVDSQTPSIRWTLRRINYQEKENTDGSVTVTITYNLPIDPESIPDGWSPVYDADGKTVHKIRKTIKQGENYDKNVTVKRNGPIDEKVTTPVKKIWDKQVSPVPHPQTGEKSVIAIIAVASIGIAVIAFVALKKRGE